MFLSKSKCWHSNNCLHFLKRAVPLTQAWWVHSALPIDVMTSEEEPSKVTSSQNKLKINFNFSRKNKIFEF